MGATRTYLSTGNRYLAVPDCNTFSPLSEDDDDGLAHQMLCRTAPVSYERHSQSKGVAQVIADSQLGEQFEPIRLTPNR